jgi:hypothetical protein
MSIDNPTKHILVKDVHQFEWMLYRRGCTSFASWSDVHGMVYATMLGNEVYQFREDFFLHETVEIVSHRLEVMMGNGMHFVWCKQCHEPLLKIETGHAEWIETGGDAYQMYDNAIMLMPGVAFEMTIEYRSAKAGPASPVIESCVNCGVLLDGNTSEIEDCQD